MGFGLGLGLGLGIGLGLGLELGLGLGLGLGVRVGGKGRVEQLYLRRVADDGYGMGPPPVHSGRWSVLHREGPTWLGLGLEGWG